MPEKTPITSPTPAQTPRPKRKRSWWGRWLVLLLLLGIVSCSTLDGSLRGMMTFSFDITKELQDLLGDEPIDIPAGQDSIQVAAPGGRTMRSREDESTHVPTAARPSDGLPPGGTQPSSGEQSSSAPGVQQAAVSSGGEVGRAQQSVGYSAPAASGAGEGGTGGTGGTGTAGGTGSPPPLQADVITVSLVNRNGQALQPAFHFEGGTARLVIDERRFTPGIYTLRIARFNPNTGQTTVAEQEFPWGVLAMNTDKDRYRPNETGRIDFGVLDEFGEIVCDAELTLSIKKPDGTLTSLSTDEGTIEVTGTCGLKEAGLLIPDYTTEFTYGQAGAYELTLVAVRPNVADHAVSTMTSTVQVVTQAPYIIKRTAATRLWPFGPSTMDIEVEFLEPFSGTVTDIVPDGFQILGTDPASTLDVSGPDNDVHIKWNGSWSAGETAMLGYMYDAPDISPEFYLIGPLTLRQAQGDSETIELRQWQIANDAELKSTGYKIPADVVPSGGGEEARSSNYYLADTVGEANIGFGRSGNYDINAGYRQAAQGTYIAAACTNTVTIPSISLTGQSTGSGSCTVTTDSLGGYRLSWRNAVNNHNGLVGYWPLDETTGTTAYDMSGYGNSGTHQNTPTISGDVPSHYFSTRSLTFNGTNQSVAIPNDPQLSLTTYTVSAWVNPSIATAGNNDVILAKGAYNYLLYFSGAGNNTPTIYSSGLTPTALNANTAISQNAWSHIAASYDGTTRKIYINGVLRGSDTPSGTPTMNTSNLEIGSSDSNSFNFPGNIDDVRIFNRALSYADIQSLASKSPPGSLTKSGSQVVSIPPYNYPATGGLIAQWRMDEPVSGTVADSSGYDNDGTPDGTSGDNNKPQPSTDIPTGAGVRDFRSLDFDGSDDRVDVADSTAWDFGTGPVTMATWVYFDTVKNTFFLQQKSGGSNGGFEWWYANSTNELMFNADNNTNLIAKSWTPSASTWYHIAYTRSSNTHTLYVDGASIGTATSATGITDVSGVVRMGARDLNGTYEMDGKMNDVRIYNRALSAAEIKALYGTPDTWSVAATSKAWGGRLRSISTDTDSKWGTDASSEKWLHVGGGDHTVVTRSTPNHPSGSTEILQFRAEIGSAAIQQAGLYKTVVLVTATAL